MQNRDRNFRVIYTVFAGLILFGLYVLIFSFSAQDGETSGGISFQLSKLGVELWNDLTHKDWSENLKTQWAEYFEFPLRKLAHFSEYALLGFLVESILLCWKKQKFLYGVGAFFWVFCSAAIDEIHQLFVPGRCGTPWDVLLDSAGGLFGIVLCWGTVFLWKRRMVTRCGK